MDKQLFASMIVKYWYLLEFLSQSDFPVQSKANRELCEKAAEGKTRAKRIIVYHTVPGPKEVGDTKTHDDSIEILTALKNDSSIYRSYGVLSDEIHICLGRVERWLLADRLQQAFDEHFEFPEKNHKSVCLIALKCDAQGRYLPGSIQVSPLVWGIHKLLSNNVQLTKENLSDFLAIDDYRAEMQRLDTQLTELLDDKAVGVLLTAAVLSNIMAQVEQTYLIHILETAQKFYWNGAIIYRRYQTETNKANDTELLRDSDLSNRFFLDDLYMIENALKNKNFGKNHHEQALLDYIIGPYSDENPDLHWMNVENRLDVRSQELLQKEKRIDFFHQHLDITAAPLGKWPSKFMPCFMQQLAVNLSWKPSEDCFPVFSVNGPPGTGKTTLLKEIIAGNIVERAELLAQYKTPDDAFVQCYFQDGDKSNNGYSQYYSTYYSFRDDRLKNYGMLVASSNNAAVENITKELPDGIALLKGLNSEQESDSAIRQGLMEVQNLFQIDSAEQECYTAWDENKRMYAPGSYPDIYFTKLANDLAKNKDKNQNRWGLISAPFGKSSNLKEYIHTVLKPYIASFGDNKKIKSSEQKYTEVVQQFNAQLHKVKQMQKALQNVSGARKNFIKKETSLNSKSEELANRKIQLEQNTELIQKKIANLHQELNSAEAILQKYQKELVDLQQQKDLQHNLQMNLENQLQNVREQIIELESHRRFLDIILEILHRPTMLSRTIQEKYQALQLAEAHFRQELTKTEQFQHQVEQKKQKYDMQNNIIKELKCTQKQLSQKEQELSNQISQIYQEMMFCSCEIENARISYEEILKEASERSSEQAMSILDDKFFLMHDSEEDEESTAAQLANPWHTALYNREREKLFYQALKLHKAFLLASKACLWNFKNLLLFWKEPGDDQKIVTVSQRDREAAFSSLLNTVFLLTPVLSTTFAAAGNMLSAIQNSGEIGCLIIDEAGQASPQMALGLLFRARRAIVVGDPRQIEPVVTDELDLIKRVIQNDYTALYQSKTHSVQQFADRLNNIGTVYKDGESETWVGCPLVVHRRCMSPMFEISNALSYNNMMKQQTASPSQTKETEFCRSSSGWINVSGSEKSTMGKDHFVEEQGKKAWELIMDAFRLVEGIPSLFVITPFTSVRDGMKKLIQCQPEYYKDRRISEWAEKNIGTVHTFQGKEADQVIFLLGCDKNSLSAVRWVNTNIVNVAVTRAKYRVYVIGDYNIWRESELFQKVKGILDSYALCALKKATDNDEKPTEKQIKRLLQEVPGVDSLTINGELDDAMTAPLFQKLDSLWGHTSLTPEQLSAFGLSSSDMDYFPVEIRRRLINSIQVHHLFTMMKERYNLKDMDTSCVGILLCKIMESLLKEVLLVKLKALFPDEKLQNQKLCNLKSQRATTGTFSTLLKKETLRSQLAALNVTLFGQVCDEQWWKTYAEELENFRLVRNVCCHSEPLNWQQEASLIEILFTKRELINTLVGNVL